MVDGLYSQIREAGRGDWHKYGWEEHDWFDAEPERIKTWSGQRRTYLLQKIAEFCNVEGPFFTINEAMPDNVDALCDPDELAADDCHDPWIEIFNSGLEPASLQGLYLKIDQQDGAPLRIGHPIQVPPLGHTVLWLDGEPEQGRNHLALRMPASGGSISLYKADGVTLLDRLSYELPPPDRSWGRFPDGASESGRLPFASPGSRNRSGPYVAVIEPPDSYAPADQPIHLTAEIGDDGYVTGATLNYAIGDGAWQNIPMVRTRYGIYEATIPAQSSGSVVSYTIDADDSEGLRSRSPSSDPQDTHLILVGFQPPAVRISRFGAAPVSTAGEKTDGWIELHNYGEETIDLAGMYLSNQPTDSTMFVIQSDSRLEAGRTMLFVTDGDTDAGPTHTNFALDPAGGSVALFDARVRFNRLIDLHRYGNEVEGDGGYACPSANATWIASTPGLPLSDDQTACLPLFLPQIRGRG